VVPGRQVKEEIPLFAWSNAPRTCGFKNSISIPMKIKNLVELFSILPEDERIIVDVLRQIIIETLPEYCKEKISYNVPFFYGNKGICIIWPSTVPRGGIKNGVLLGFWYGYKLNDADGFLSRGTNKQIFYKIYQTPEELDDKPIKKLLKEAIKLDSTFRKSDRAL
jgi:hypothetical protein